MKLAALFSTLLATSFLVATPMANAFIPVPGAFVASSCGEQAPAAALSIHQVCFGQVTAEPGEKATPAVSFRLTDGTDRIYKVSSTASLLTALDSGDSKSLYYLVADDGSRSTMKVMKSRTNEMLAVSGALELPEGDAPYFITKFESVLVLQ